MASTFELPVLSTTEVTVISLLGDNPNTDNGLSASELKARFDKAGLKLREFLDPNEAASFGNVLQAEIRAIEDANVGTAKLIDGCVTTAKLDGGAVTTAKIASSAVTEAKIDSNAVTAAKIAANAVSTAYTASIQTVDWTGVSAPFSAAITVPGLTATDTPIVDAIMSGTYSTDELRDEAWGVIYRAVTSADTITFYAKEKPNVELPFSLLCIRK